jgi:hypothetical protein
MDNTEEVPAVASPATETTLDTPPPVPEPPPVEAQVWLPAEQQYLIKMSQTCKRLTDKFKAIHSRYNKYQARFRIPSIILSSITGLFSMGNSNFPDGYQQYVSIGVGIVSVSIAVLGSIETYMKIGDIMGHCMLAATNFHKLKEKIDCELALPVKDRRTSGILFIRECSTEYHKAFAVGGNFIKSDWFIQPEYELGPIP